jgi:hypothetical protein
MSLIRKSYLVNPLNMKIVFSILFLSVSFLASSQPIVLSQRDQARVIDELLEDRLRNTLPALMRREGFDMWVIISREYNEDPVIRTLLPATWHAARRTTMLVVFDRGADKEMEYLAVARYDVGKVFQRAWDPDANPDNGPNSEKLLLNVIPKKLACKQSPTLWPCRWINQQRLR